MTRSFFVKIFIISFIAQPISVFAAGPTVQNVSLSVREDTPRNFTLNSSGRPSSTTFTIVTPPQHGTLVMNGSGGTYTPSQNYYGDDSFTYKATANGETGNTATVSMSVSAVNDPPIATSGITAATQKNVPVRFFLSGSDIEGSPLVYSVSSTIAGASSVNSTTGEVTYTPGNNIIGTGYVYFRVSDGQAWSSTGVATITIANTNTAPVAQNVSLTINEDSVGQVRLSATDSDNDALTFSIVDGPTHGTTSISSATLTFTPSPDYFGTESFTYRAADASTVSNIATISITVNGTNDVPVANTVELTTNSLTSVTGTLDGFDVDGDALTYSLIGYPTTGTAKIQNENQVTYTPREGFFGTATFAYRVNDGKRTADGTVVVNVLAPPVAHDMSVAIHEHEQVTIIPTLTDADSPAVTLMLADAPDFGTIVPRDDGWIYTPQSGFRGLDTFTFKGYDGSSFSEDGTVFINVHPSVGVPEDDFLQVGVNFVNFSPTSDETSWILPALKERGVQFIRQPGGADTTWSSIEPSNDLDFSGYGEGVRAEVYGESIQIINSTFEHAFASCTPPWLDMTNPNEFVRTFEESADCADYLIRASNTIDQAAKQAEEALGFGPGTILRNVEIGNEMFHWIAYQNEIDFTPTEQASMLRSASEVLRENITNAWIFAPSIMLNNTGATDWYNEVTAAIGTDWFDEQTIHAYERWESYPEELDFFYENLHVPGKPWSVTETGRSSDPTSTRVPNSTMEDKIAAIPQHFSFFLGAGAKSVAWHSWFAGENNETELRGTELYSADGTPDLSAAPFQLFTNELIPFTQIINLSDEKNGIFLFEYRVANGQIKYVAWGDGQIILPEGMTKMTSFYPQEDGSYVFETVASGSSISLENMPYLLK